MWRRTIWQSFPPSQPTFLHIIIPSWQLDVSMIKLTGSLICNEQDKLMVKMTILFWLWYIYACMLRTVEFVFVFYRTLTTATPLSYNQHKRTVLIRRIKCVSQMSAVLPDFLNTWIPLTASPSFWLTTHKNFTFPFFQLQHHWLIALPAWSSTLTPLFPH